MRGTLWMRNALRVVILLLEALNFNVLWATFILAVSFFFSVVDDPNGSLICCKILNCCNCYLMS